MIQEIKIKYNQKQTNIDLIVGVICAAVSLGSWLYGASKFYFILAVSLVYLGSYLYKKKRNYFEVRHSGLKKDLGATIPISEIVQAKIFAGEYIFKSGKNKIILNRNMMDKESIPVVEKLISDIQNKTSSNSRLKPLPGLQFNRVYN
ncbi:MAG TPA: hypothetical protein PLA69_03915 [Flavobacterium sp.]|nr:hypothetical protein [Flavobacterium sp.]